MGDQETSCKGCSGMVKNLSQKPLFLTEKKEKTSSAVASSMRQLKKDNPVAKKTKNTALRKGSIWDREQPWSLWKFGLPKGAPQPVAQETWELSTTLSLNTDNQARLQATGMKKRGRLSCKFLSSRLEILFSCCLKHCCIQTWRFFS